MTAHDTFGVGVDLRDIGVGLLCLVAVALTVFAQFGWMVAFDSTGLDVHAPDIVFMALLPAATLAAVPLLVARHRYDRRTALAVGGVVFAASTVVATYTVRLFVVCGGPRC